MRAAFLAGSGPLYDGAMKRKQLRFGEGFRVMRGNRASQAAEMGNGEAIVGGKRHALSAGSLVPPAYKSNGDPLPRGRK
jgi:hypothetical protein